MLIVDVIVAEIGSTTTVINAFCELGTLHPKFIGQAIAPTTVLQGDVTIGLECAIRNLEQKLKTDIKWNRMMATSSAAGGLKMTVHGLVYDMTAKAAKEAALGAGAVLKMLTAGRLSSFDLKRILEIRPNIILLAGGVDYGEKATVIHNAEKIAELGINTPIIYAGNIAARDEIKEIFGGKNRIFFVDNVYPRIDELVVEPARKVIQDVFEDHIIIAPGMEKIRTIVDGHIIPTPGAVMNAAKFLKEEIGDLMVVDIGGATTDVHSVTEDSDEIAKFIVTPEPEAKRTVEGDLGIFVNCHHVLENINIEEADKALNISVLEAIKKQPSIPKTPEEVKLAKYLAEISCIIAVNRHAGEIKYIYGPAGRYTIASGKDLTQVKWIIGTGGALTRLPQAKSILQKIQHDKKGKKLLPSRDAKILIDHDYIMASVGALAKELPREAVDLLKKSLKTKFR